MRKVFLSHSFAEADRPLASLVDRLIRSQNLVPITGRNCAGGQLVAEVSQKIAEADALVALLTQRAAAPAGGTHPWVLQEYALARADPAKRAVAVWETGVPVQGMGVGYEHVELDPADPLPALVRLSEILGEWKQRAGRFLKVQLMPEDLARRIGQAVDRVECKYRCQQEGKEEEWRTAPVRREVGGVFGYLLVADNTEMIQIRATGPGLSCESPYTPLRMFVQLEQTP